MSASSFSALVVSDFNAKLLAQLLMRHAAPVDAAIEVAPFGQVYQTLMAPPADPVEHAIVWTTPERTIPAFAEAMQLSNVDQEECLQQVREYAAAVRHFAERCRSVILPTWLMPAGFRGYGLLDWRPGLGVTQLLARMNLALSDALADLANVYLLDASRWLQGATEAPAKMWYAAKVPFHNKVFDAAARDCLAALTAISGLSRKLIVVDLDNTLWGGVIGETGWQGVRLGGHDHVGEAFKDFQAALLAQVNRGVQLAIVSKNDEAVALEALDHHPEMLLKREHFAGWRINWHDKAANIDALVRELNLGLAAVVFIDDNPAERDRVSSALPDVLVPEWPADPTAYVSAFRALDCFDTAAVTREDRARTAMYVAERARREVRLGTDSVQNWLHQLDTRLTVMPLTDTNIARVTQLFNKTNQLNLSTRRMSEEEIREWVSPGHRSLLAVSAADKFGDLGIVGVLAVEVNEGAGQLVDFILSCRAMGREVENAMLHVAASEIERLGGATLAACYLPTERNRPTLDVFRAAQLSEDEEHQFVAESLSALSKPEVVTLLGLDNLES